MRTKSAITEEHSAPLPFYHEPWMAQRFELDPKSTAPHNQDRTTKAAHYWKGLKDEIRRIQVETHNFTAITPNGEIVVIDPDGLRVLWVEIESLNTQLSKIESSIRSIMAISPEYLCELENTAYTHAKVDNHYIQQLTGLSFTLSSRNRDLQPEDILKLPAYVEKKAEADAEIERANKVLAEVQPKIQAINEALAAIGI
jgi:hypothetical protein